MVKILPVIKKYTYSGSHVSTVNALLAGGYDAGGLQDTLALPLINKGLVRIVAYSSYYPICDISDNKDMDPELLEAVKDILQAKEKLGNSRVDLSIVYSSCEYDHREVVDAIRETTNNAPLILIVIPRSSAMGIFIGASS